MNRRDFIGLIGSGIAASHVRGVPSLAPGQPSPVGSRPNFLFIICDDLMFRSIRSVNNPEVHTPNLDRLAASGCTFTHSFHQGSWSAAVCVSSRTMLNSGLSAFHAEEGLDDVPSWGQTLGQAGYQTYICGKWHLDPVVLQRSFQEMGPIGPGMFDSTPEGGAAYGRPRPGDDWQPWDESLKGHWIHTQLWRNQTPDRIQHSAAMFTDVVIEHLLNKAARREAPFFIYLGFNTPHDPRQAPREYLDLYPEDKIEVPPNFLPQHPFDLGDMHVRDEMLAPFPRTSDAIRLHRREFYALLSYTDAQVGRILDALEQSGKAENTYVIFTADHGLTVGEHGLMGKQNLYDCSVRMPLIIAGPGINRGSRIDSLVYLPCLYATTCDLAGIPVPSTVEFKSLAPLLRGRSGVLYEEVFSYYRDFQRMIRTPTHQLIVYPQVKKVQLFDLVRDPWEMHDLSGDPASATILQGLGEQIISMQQKLGDTVKLDSALFRKA